MAQGTPTRGKLNLMTKVGGFDEAECYAVTIQYLSAGSLPSDKMLRKEVTRWASRLAIHESPLPAAATQGENTRLRFLHGDGSSAPYLEPPFRKDFLKRMHDEDTAGHGRDSPSMPELPSVEGEKRMFRERSSAILGQHRYQAFRTMGNRPHRLATTTPSGNRWIITAIDYATGWPLAKALPDAIEEAIAEFLHEDIFTVYGAPAEFLNDNGANLLATSVQYFIKPINTKHRTTTPYHPRTNGKVENFNGLLGRMLTKYLHGETHSGVGPIPGPSLVRHKSQGTCNVRQEPILLGVRHPPTLARRHGTGDIYPKPCGIGQQDYSHQPRTGFTPTERVEESRPRDWNPAHEAEEKTQEENFCQQQ
ncbi:hypothetical protein PDIDSM_2481 [Penicillium digitatum]|nr:hypothetical protein PDIDSM_2481 [Penicillium digitatum]